MRHGTVYRDPRRYCAFPDVARLRDGEVLVSFRDAVTRGEPESHIDSTSRAVCVRSGDGGESWSEPTVIFDEDGYDLQDPSVMQTAAGTVLANFFKRRVLREEPWRHHVVGTYTARSTDGGRTWGEPTLVPSEGFTWLSTGAPIVQLGSGELVVPVYENARTGSHGRRALVMCSVDDGRTWRNPVVIADDPLDTMDFDEPALLPLPSGRIICLLRVARVEQVLWQTESADGGHTWTVPHRTPIWGYPCHLLRLQSGDVLCSYGYRRPPYGVRACLSRDGGRTWDLEHEIVLRADGLHGDLGYPGAVELPAGEILAVYYFHEPSGTRYIASTRYQLAEALS